MSYIPTLKGGEQKTKPTQHGVKELRVTGLSPDFIVCRCEKPITKEVRSKVALFTNVLPECVFDAPDLEHTFEVPIYLANQGIAEKLSKILELIPKTQNLKKWEKMTTHALTIEKTMKGSPLKIAIVGKYTGFQDSYLSVIKSLQYSSYYADECLELKFIDSTEYEKAKNEEERQVYINKFADIKGILVPGGFGDRGIEGKIMAAQIARTKKIPYLGLCLGLQIALIEVARNILGWKDANSTEFAPESTKPVIIFMPEISPIIKGGTMRLGAKETYIE